MAYDISDLNQLINLRSGHVNQQAQRKSDYDDSINKGLEHLIESIDKVNDTESFDFVKAQIDDIITKISPDNAEGLLMVNQGFVELNDREDDIAYYNIAMDDAANLIEEIKPKPYIIENQETGTSEERIDADVIWENATINDIADWQLKVNNVLDAFYVDMFAEKPQANDFIDKRHIPTINEIERFKFQLEAASLALEENGTIDQHELSFVVSGNKLGLENARKQHAERSNARLTSITSSLNSIRNLKSKLMSSLALSGAKGDDSSSSTARVLLEEYRANPEIADKIIANSAQLKMLNFPENYINYDDAVEETIFELSKVTPAELIQIWDSEERLYMRLFQLEHDKWFKWQGMDWAEGMSHGYLDREHDRKVEEELNNLLNK